MDPRSQFCHNLACPDRGQVGRGNIRVHSRKERRYRCRTCQATFAETTGTPSYRLHHGAGLLRPVPEGRLLLGQVVQRYVQRHLAEVEQRVVFGTAAAITAVLSATGTGTMIHTAHIERLNATFRACLAPLTRRGRALARTQAALTAGMYLVGCAYNFCWVHASLRLAAPPASPWKWQQRTPAMAAGLTDHCWTMDELLHDQVPLPAWRPPKHRGRPPKRVVPEPLTPAA